MQRHQSIRETPMPSHAAARTRGDAPVESTGIWHWTKARRPRFQAAETAQADQNKASKLVGACKGQGRRGRILASAHIGQRQESDVTACQARGQGFDAQLTTCWRASPNLPRR